MNDGLAILILAAGSSSRMGQSKQQLQINEQSLLAQSVETAVNSGIGKVYVVLGSEQNEHRALIKNKPVEIIFNSRWQTGMGSSIKAGLNHILEINSNTDAIIIVVCDQPLIRSNHLKSLVKKYQETKSPVIASVYSNTKGVPALFNHNLFHELLQLEDGHGAKKIIQKHQSATIDFPEGSIDLDTPEDYKNFLQITSKKMP